MEDIKLNETDKVTYYVTDKCKDYEEELYKAYDTKREYKDIRVAFARPKPGTPDNPSYLAVINGECVGFWQDDAEFEYFVSGVRQKVNEFYEKTLKRHLEQY